MKPLLLFMSLLAYTLVHSQVNTEKLSKASIPKKAIYIGELKTAVRWKDNRGIHYVLTSETGITSNKKGGEGRNAALYAYHYLMQGDTLKQTWRLYDYIKDCPVDLEAGFVRNSFAVTDLNKNGTAEVWLMYRTYCKGDVSPSEMKIIMYQAEKKYALRGTTKVQVSEKEYYGGNYSFDAAFKKAPEVFRKYAEQLWKKNVSEKSN